MSNIVLHKTEITQTAFANYFTNSSTGKIHLLYGDKRVFSLALLLASQVLIKNKPLAVIDGGNRFSVHTISQLARQYRINPDTLLKRIYVSRGFTPYQMEAAVNDRLAPFLKRIGSNTALIFGLLDTFYDEQVRFKEVEGMLRRILIHLDKLRKQGISILIVSKEWNVLPKERNQFLDLVKRVADTVYKLEDALPENGKQLETDDEIKFLVEKERKKDYGTHTTNIHRNNRQRN